MGRLSADRSGGAVAELSPSELRSTIGACLQSLVRNELIEPARSNLPQEDSVRFTHILVRDAAYQAIPKAVRAEMHERLAEWIQLKTRDLAGEYEEVVGYHLDRAHLSLSSWGRRPSRRERWRRARRSSFPPPASARWRAATCRPR